MTERNLAVMLGSMPNRDFRLDGRGLTSSRTWSRLTASTTPGDSVWSSSARTISGGATGSAREFMTTPAAAGWSRACNYNGRVEVMP